MSAWEANGATDEWYTPKYIFDALGCGFDLDVAACPEDMGYVPAGDYIRENSLEKKWSGMVWMNPPFGGRNGITPWLDKFFSHGNGIALTPDRTSAPWWQNAAKKARLVLFIAGKPKFERPDGTVGKSPGHGVTLMSIGFQANQALMTAHNRGLGLLMEGSRYE